MVNTVVFQNQQSEIENYYNVYIMNCTVLVHQTPVSDRTAPSRRATELLASPVPMLDASSRIDSERSRKLNTICLLLIIHLKNNKQKKIQ